MANKRETFFNYPNASQNVAVQRQLYFITKNDTLSIVQVASDATSLTAQQLNVLKDRAIMIQYDGLIYTFVGATDDTLTYRHVISGQVFKDMTITLPGGTFTVTDVTISQDIPIVNVTFTAEDSVELSEADMLLIQNDPTTILCADISALNHGYKKLYMTRGATPQEGYSFIFSDFGDTHLVDVAYGYATYTYFKWETSYLHRHDVTENSIYVERADGTLVTIPLAVDTKPNTAVVRNNFGGIEVNDTPSNDNEAINKKYADGRFVKNQSQYTSKPNYGVYTFTLDGDTIKDSLTSFANYPQSYALAQYDSSAKLHSDTVSATDADDTVTNRKYVDDADAKKLNKATPQEGVYRVYANKPDGDGFYPVSNGPVGGTLAERLDGGRLAVGTPTADDDATSKKYVDTQFVKSQSQYSEKPDYGVYVYLLDGGIFRNSLLEFTNYAKAYAIVQYDPNAKLYTETPLDSDSDKTVANKKYVDSHAFPSSGGTIQGDVIIAGNLTVTGENKSADVENLRVKDLLIEVGKDNPGFTFPAGLKYKYSVDGKYSALVWDKNGIAHVGDVVLDANGNVNLAESTQLQALATRPESGTDGGIMVWDNENKTMMIDGQTVANLQGDLAILQEGKLNKVTETGTYARLYNIKPDGTQDTVAFTSSAIAYTVVQRDSNGDVIVPVEPSSQNSAASKNYIDSLFVAKRNNTDGLYHVYAFTDTQLELTVDIGRSAYSLALRDANGEVSTNSPTAPTSAANKNYVDNGFVKKVTPTEDIDAVYASIIDGGVRKDDWIQVITSSRPYAIPRYTAEGDLRVPTTPNHEQGATSKEYVDSGFVKSAFKYVAKPDYGVYTFGIEENTITTLTDSPVPFAVVQYSANGDVNVPTNPTGNQGATSKTYVDNLVLQGGTSKVVKIGTYADNGLSVSASKIGNVVTMFLTAIGNIATGTYTITVPTSCYSASISYDFTVNNTTTAAQIPFGVLGWTGESDIAEGSVISLTWNHSVKTFTFSVSATVSQMQYAIQYVAEDMTALNPSTSGKALATVESITNNVISISTDYQDAGSIFDCNSFEVEIYNPLTNNVDLSACSISDGIKSVSAQSMLSNPLAGGMMTCKDDIIVLTGRKIGETLHTTCRVKRAREYLAIPVYQYCSGYQGDLIVHFGPGAMLNTDTFNIDTLVDSAGTLILPAGTYSSESQLPIVLGAEIVWDGNRQDVSVMTVSANRVNFYIGNLKISGSSTVSNYEQLYFGRTGNVNIAEHDPTPRIVFGG